MAEEAKTDAEELPAEEREELERLQVGPLTSILGATLSASH